MTVVRYARLVGIAWVLLLAASVRAQSPNVLLLTVESFRADHVGCYGYARPTTPNLDRLAARGARFESFHAQAPWTIPSLISMFTGLYPAAHGVDRRGRQLPRAADAVPRILARAGWRVPGASYLLTLPEFAGLGFEPVPAPDWNGRPLEAMAASLRDRAPEPFFVWMHYKWTHLPYDPPAEDLALFRAAPLPDGEGIRAVRSGEMIVHGSVAFTPEEKRAVADLYDANLHRFDRDLARLLAVLDERGVLARTIVVVTADHGEELFDHGFVGHGSTAKQAKLYEELLHVPLVVAGPGVPAGRVVRGLAEQVDLAPTLLDLLGIAPPPGMEGVSRLSTLRGDATIRDGAAFADTVLAGFQSGAEESRTRLRSFSDGRWKLILTLTPDGDSAELYDLTRDPGEREDLAAREEGRVRAMKRRIAEWIDRTLRTRLDLLRRSGRAAGEP